VGVCSGLSEREQDKTLTSHLAPELSPAVADDPVLGSVSGRSPANDRDDVVNTLTSSLVDAASVPVCVGSRWRGMGWDRENVGICIALSGKWDCTMWGGHHSHSHSCGNKERDEVG
jgi:hypothetical protein